MGRMLRLATCVAMLWFPAVLLTGCAAGKQQGTGGGANDGLGQFGGLAELHGTWDVRMRGMLSDGKGMSGFFIHLAGAAASAVLAPAFGSEASSVPSGSFFMPLILACSLVARSATAEPG